MNIDVKFSETDSNFDVQFEDAKTPTSSTSDHGQLINRDKENQHPIGAITGLENALGEKLNSSQLPLAIDIALANAKESGDFDGTGISYIACDDLTDVVTVGIFLTDFTVKTFQIKHGYTPRKGVDYYTEQEKSELLDELIGMLPVYQDEVVE